MMGEEVGRLEAFSQLLKHLREPLLIVSSEGCIRASNTAGAQALGASLNGLDRTLLSTYSPDPVGLAATLRRPGGELEVRLRARDGRRFYGELIELEPDLLLVRLWGAEHEESSCAKNLFERLSPLSEFALDAQPIDDVAGALLAQAVSVTGAVAGEMFLVDRGRTTLELKVAASPGQIVNRSRLISLSSHSPITDTVKKGIPIFLTGIDDYVAAYPQLASAHPDVARNAFASVPIEIDGLCIGALTVSFGAPSNFGESERRLLSFVATQSANAIARARGVRSLTVTTPVDPTAVRLERLHAFAGALAQAISSSQVAEAVVELGIAATLATSGELWLCSRERKELRLIQSVGPDALPSEDYQQVKLDHASRLPIVDAVLEGASIWIESREQLAEQYPQLSTSREGALACIPLFTQGRCIGGICFRFDGAHRFVETRRDFLQVIAWHSAQAIERASLYSAARRAKDEAEESRRRSDFMADIGSLLSSSLDVADILQSISQAAVPRIAQSCIVKIASARLGMTTFASHIDPTKASKLVETVDLISAVADDPFGVGLVVRTGKSLYYPRVSIESVRAQLGSAEDLAAMAAEIDGGSAMIVPINARGSVFGAIILCRCASEEAFDAGHLALAEELGKRVGLAVDNARLYQESREADRLKDEFLAMLSHELRNPLAPILTALELMTLRGGTEFARERAIISRHVRQVGRLVDDLFDVSRVTRGKVKLSKQCTELRAIVETAIEMVAPLTEQRDHRLELVAPDAGLFVLADSARLAQAISNILTNAAKYTAPGGEIYVTVCTEGSDAVVRVRDSGVGIAPSLLPRIFELFVQGETSLDRAPGGLGIGLTVVKHIVEMHGGSIAAHSQGVGHGSEFRVRLPLAVGVGPTQDQSDRPPRPLTSERRVLIVDDNRDAAELLGEALDILGWSVQVVHDGAAALYLAPVFRPELVLLDIGLPAMDGYEVAKNLRQLDLGASLRLVAVSGYGQASDRERSRDAGFDEHIVKPVHLDTLRRVIERTAPLIRPS